VGSAKYALDGCYRVSSVDRNSDLLECTGKKPRYFNHTACVECHIQLPPQPERGFPGAGYADSWWICLRAKTVHRLNRKCLKEQRLRFKSKYRLPARPWLRCAGCLTGLPSRCAP